MAQLPPQFWMLKSVDKDGTVHFKAATGTRATPKLYLHKAVAETAGGSWGGGGKWVAVPVSINFL